MNDVCINQGIYQQQQQLQQQISSANTLAKQTTSNIQTNNVDINTNTISQSQSSINQNVQSNINLQTQSGSSIVSQSSGMTTFDVSNTGVMYLLQLFGLAQNIPSNCATFTANFLCVKCSTGYSLSSNGCSYQIITNGSSSIINSNSGSTTSANTQSSSSSISSSSTSSNLLNSNTNSGSSSSSIIYNTNNNSNNNDPNCQVFSSNGDGSCTTCYFRYYYNLQTKKCTVVNTLCATWDKFGSCLTCYSGYKLNGTICSI